MHSRQILLFLAALAIVPGAAAFTLTVDFPTERLEPGLSPAEGTLEATATCEEILLASSATSNPLTTESLPVIIASDSPATVVVSGMQTLLMPTEPCTSDPQGTVTTGPQTYSFFASREAPGLTALPVTMTATLDPDGSDDPATDSVEGTVTPGFYGAMQFVANDPIQAADIGQSVLYTITMTNVGNAATVVHFKLGEETPPGVVVELPDDVTVQSTTSGGTNAATATVTVRFDTSGTGFINELTNIPVLMETWASKDSTQTGNEGTAALLLRVRDVKGAPAPSPLFAVVVLVAAIAVARRRA